MSPTAPATLPRARARLRARLLALPVALLAAVGLGACGAAVSTSGYTGEQKAVAQRISDFQSHATGRDEQKVCQNDLSGAVKSRLQAAGNDCKSALKHQLTQIDTLELTIESIQVKGKTASAQVKSTWSGKSRKSTLGLVKEGGAWKIAALS